MTDRLNLRLRVEDQAALAQAAKIIAGPVGCRHIGRTAVLRHVLAEFNAQHETALPQEPRA